MEYLVLMAALALGAIAFCLTGQKGRSGGT